MNNVWVLTAAQALAFSSVSAAVLVGGIVGESLAPDPRFATLPMALFILGTASTTLPAARLMLIYDRKICFILAALVAAIMTLIAYYAIDRHDFWLFCFATFGIGAHIAFVQQYRFAAAESVEPSQAGQAISMIMLGGLVAAFTGPEIANQTALLNQSRPYSATFLALALVLVVNSVTLAFYQNVSVSQDINSSGGRTVRELATQANFILAVSASVTGFVVMSYIMTATPISMHSHNGYSLSTTTRVIQAHMIAMFLPSLFTGKLINRFGELPIITIGALLMLTCIAIALSGIEIWHYSAALITLGVGWNFLFVGGSTLLTKSYLEQEKFRAQGLHDFTVFSFQALAALSSGSMLHRVGWSGIQYSSLPIVLLFLGLLLWQLRLVRLNPQSP
ncbi:MAG TPA: MFS transporter [Gammaproteobacteria bacterium]|nr:MFS transporter [Gammaproteobacteria bacterium]